MLLKTSILSFILSFASLPLGACPLVFTYDACHESTHSAFIGTSRATENTNENINIDNESKKIMNAVISTLSIEISHYNFYDHGYNKGMDVTVNWTADHDKIINAINPTYNQVSKQTTLGYYKQSELTISSFRSTLNTLLFKYLSNQELSIAVQIGNEIKTIPIAKAGTGNNEGYYIITTTSAESNLNTVSFENINYDNLMNHNYINANIVITNKSKPARLMVSGVRKKLRNNYLIAKI